MIVYILGTPAGILIGAFIGGTGGIAYVILIGLAGGILVYMSVCHILMEEFQMSDDINPLDSRSTIEKNKS